MGKQANFEITTLDCHAPRTENQCNRLRVLQIAGNWVYDPAFARLRNDRLEHLEDA